MSAPVTTHDKSTQTALLAGLSGYLIWGISPLFFQLLDFASATEIIVHRVIWAVPLLFLIIWYGGQRAAILAPLKDRKTLITLMATAALISVNWWIFVHAVNNGQVLQASLGYYINPLMSVAVGVLVLREPLGPWRITAIVLASLGVINLIVGFGELPWISLALAVSFTAYGYLRKTAAVDGRVGLFWETLFILPFAIIGWVWLVQSGGDHYFQSPRQAFLLMAAGLVTVVPLLLYIIGARGLRLSTMGLMQFLAPSLQFTIGVMGGEPFTRVHMITFGLIWAGVAAFAYSQLRRDRAKLSSG